MGGKKLHPCKGKCGKKLIQSFTKQQVPAQVRLDSLLSAIHKSFQLDDCAINKSIQNVNKVRNIKVSLFLHVLALPNSKNRTARTTPDNYRQIISFHACHYFTIKVGNLVVASNTIWFPKPYTNQHVVLENQNCPSPDALRYWKHSSPMCFLCAAWHNSAHLHYFMLWVQCSYIDWDILTIHEDEREQRWSYYVHACQGKAESANVELAQLWSNLWASKGENINRNQTHLHIHTHNSINIPTQYTTQ